MGVKDLNNSILEEIKFLEGVKTNILTLFYNLDLTQLKRDDLKKGLAGNDVIKPKYNELYFSLKKTLSSYNLSGTPDLFVSGDFYKSLFQKMDTLGIYEIESNLTKDYFINLLNKYNDDLLDLNKSTLDKLVKELKEKIYVFFQK